MAEDDAWWEAELNDYHKTTSRAGGALGTSASSAASPLKGALASPVVTSAPPPPPPPPPPGILAAEDSTESADAGASLTTVPRLSSAARLSVSVQSEVSVSEAESDDDDQLWEEFKLAGGVQDGETCWVNPNSREVTLVDPRQGFGDEEEFLVQLQRQQRYRRQSAIHDATGATGAPASGSGADTTDRMAPKGLTANTEAGARATAQKEDTSGELFKTLSVLATNVTQLINHPELDLVKQKLYSLRSLLDEITEDVKNEIDSQDTRNDVDALVDFRGLTWDFDNEHVHAYRARAARFPHSQFRFRNAHVPEFTAQFPLPTTTSGTEKLVKAVIHLPESSVAMKQRDVRVQESDTVAAVVGRVFESPATRAALGDPAQYVLKAVGFHEFLLPERHLFEAEYVRQLIRDSGDVVAVHLKLVKRPEPQPASETSQEMVKAYKEKVRPDVPVLGPLDYTNLSLDLNWEEMSAFPLHDMQVPFRVRVLALENATAHGLPRLDQSITSLSVHTFLYHGMFTLEGSLRATRDVPNAQHVRWMEWLEGEQGQDVMLGSMPRETRLCFLLYGTVINKRQLLGYACVQLVNQFGRLVSGEKKLRLWGLGVKEQVKNMNFIYRTTTRDNCANESAAVLRVVFDEFELPVVAPLALPQRKPLESVVGAPDPKFNPKKPPKTIRKLATRDPLYHLTQADRAELWRYRHHLTSQPAFLPMLLLSVDWSNVEHRMEVYRLLQEWTPFDDPAHALQLLDAQYADYRVREYAVNQLRRVPDDELQLYLLQLTQCLKFEPYHDSPLARFLVTRSLQSPYQIGHYFFWHLKAEMATPDFCERYACVAEEFLSHVGDFTTELRKQSSTVIKLQRVAELIVKLKNESKLPDEEVMKSYQEQLHALNRDHFAKIGSFQIPLNPKQEATTLIVEKCRYMSSKKIPLWLVFRNKDPDADPIYIIFKSGDDLRQDILTLQLLKIMDKIWLAQGLDMRLKPYRCIATGVNAEGEGVGMIEIVLNSDTTSGIQLKYGGGAIGALRLEPLEEFIREHNEGAAEFAAAVENFVRSCAGYCVATYVLGIGDRHNGNIMLTKDGHLFHIDFGHFLGNFKKKFGFNRERAAFVLTPEMAHVMGGKRSRVFGSFKDLCCEAFGVLRRHSVLLESLFILMVAAGMPELLQSEDVLYLREKLSLEESDKEAEKVFKKEIKKSLATTWRRIDNLIHNARHG